MLKSIQQRDLDRNRWIKIAMTVILVLICVSMVITLIPGLFGGPALSSNPDSVATVANEDITAAAVQQQVNQRSRGQTIPALMRGLYTKQVFDQMIFQAALQYEAQRLSMQVTPEEIRERVQEILPTAFSGNVWLKDEYTTQVERAGMSVPEFESELSQALLNEKFERLITDGITVSPAEIEREFRRRNEKVVIQYALVKPVEIAPTVHPTDDQLAAYFKTNMAKYQIPEKRSAQFVLLDVSKLRSQMHIGDDVLRAYYNGHIDDYKVQNGAHIEQILFKTLGKTDAEVAELSKKAGDIVKQARHGANFEDLAKKYSEDDQTKSKGGDLGWIGEGQMAPQVEQPAFSLPKGGVSDVIKTTYGLVIIKVVDRQTAHTKPFDEVRDSILPVVLDQKANDQANDVSNQMAAVIRQSDRQPIADIARKFNLEVQTTPPVAITDLAVGALGNSPDVRQALFQLQPGELSSPIHTDTGFVIVTPKDVLPAHQAALGEVRDKVLADCQQEKSVELARSKAEELAKGVQGGAVFEKAAKSLGLDVKTSEPFSLTGNVPDIGSASQLDAAFTMKVDQIAAPKMVGGNWLVYRVTSHQAPNIDDLAKQKQDIEQQLLQTKQSAAFAAFRTALEDRLKQEGKLTINQDALNRLTQSQ